MRQRKRIAQKWIIYFSHQEVLCPLPYFTHTSYKALKKGQVITNKNSRYRITNIVAKQKKGTSVAHAIIIYYDR